MVRAASIDHRSGLKKGEWSQEEDNKLRAYVERYGHKNWRQLPRFAGLARCGKSCRLRWLNYLMPGVKRGNYSPEEEKLILKLHQELGNKWSVIATNFPGRTDNDIKNHWHTHLRRRMQQGYSKSSKSTEKTNERSTRIDYSDHHEASSSMSTTFNSQWLVDDQMGTNYNTAAADHAYREVPSLSYDSTFFYVGLDCTAEEIYSMPSVEPITEPVDIDESLWTHSFAMDSSHNNNNNLHQQLPASLEEEIMRPFSPHHLDEINVDWPHELMQYNSIK